jgi:hypothetical protein
VKTEMILVCTMRGSLLYPVLFARNTKFIFRSPQPEATPRLSAAPVPTPAPAPLTAGQQAFSDPQVALAVELATRKSHRFLYSNYAR